MEKLKMKHNLLEYAVSAGYEIEVQNRKNLDVLNEHPNSPDLIYMNHLAQDDMFLIFDILNKHSPQRLNNVILPVSEDYADTFAFPRYFAAVRLGKFMTEFDMPRIMQSYRTRLEGADEKTLQEAEKKSRSLNLKFMREMNNRLSANPVVILAPEGHRSNGSLLPAEMGAGYIVEKMSMLKNNNDQAFAIPIGIQYDPYLGPSLHYRPHKDDKVKVTLTVGDPIEVDDLVNKAMDHSGRTRHNFQLIAHFLMSKLSSTLPEKMRGVYGSDMEEGTYKGRFELWTTKEGTQKIYDKNTGTFID